MIRSSKRKSHMFFHSCGHVRSHGKQKALYFNFPEVVSTKLETVMAYEKIVTWRVKSLCLNMAHDYQTRKNDGLWHWATMHKVILWSRDYMFSRDKEKALYLQYHKSYGHQIWQGNGLKAIRLRVVKVILLKAIKFMCQ